MLHHRNAVECLVCRVAGGEPGAADELRQMAFPALACLVRDTWQHGSGRTPLRHVVAEFVSVRSAAKRPGVNHAPAGST